MIFFVLIFFSWRDWGKRGMGGFDFLILLYNQNLYNHNRSPILPSLLLLREKHLSSREQVEMVQPWIWHRLTIQCRLGDC